MAASVLGNLVLSFRRAEASRRSLGSSRVSHNSASLTAKVSDLSFVTSQLGGLKISHDFGFSRLPKTLPSRPTVVQPLARRVCPFTGKKSNRANKVSHSNHKTKKLQFVNLQYKKIWWEAGKRFLKLRLSTKALKTIEKNGLDAVAKKAGIDLRKE
ncbi:large ribosomal subunit protein bL28c [Aristolochia californica]|uniref:large ribosomal subunit protein bL28c n=1 Tax=Aristolochia californica TaxID=171875 RepID=UPI0035E20BAB